MLAITDLDGRNSVALRETYADLKTRWHNVELEDVCEVRRTSYRAGDRVYVQVTYGARWVIAAGEVTGVREVRGSGSIEDRLTVRLDGLDVEWIVDDVADAYEDMTATGVQCYVDLEINLFRRDRDSAAVETWLRSVGLLGPGKSVARQQ